MNSLLNQLDIASWKPFITALLLPPVPLLLLILIGARLLLPRRNWGWTVILLGVAGLWFAACGGTARLIDQFVLQVPQALTPQRIAALKAEARGQATTTIVVLGGGLQPYSQEYGVANLTALSLERLRYGLWLSRETGIAPGFSGGVGWGGGAAAGGATEAEVASRIAAREFGRPLQWTESESRDTRENAARTVGLLQRAGVNHILLVTHAFHMPRARRAFVEAAAANAPGMLIEAAPLGLGHRGDHSALDWMPTTGGMTQVRNSLHEVVGLALGG